MESNRKTFFVGISIVSLLLLVYFLMTWKPEQYRWVETYDTESEHKNIKKPYDISIIYNLLNGYTGDDGFERMEKSISEELPLEEGQAANYVYIGQSPYYDSSSLNHIFEFAETGNTVFIAANGLPQNFIKKLYGGMCETGYLNENILIDDEGNYFYIDENNKKIIVENIHDTDPITEVDEDYYVEEEIDEEDIFEEEVNYESDSDLQYERKVNGWSGFEDHYDTTVYVNFFHPTLQVDQPILLKYGSRTNKRQYDWNYIEDNTFCKGAFEYTSLSYIDDFKTNYIKIPYGEGSFLIHTTPLQFTDYQLVHEEGLAAATKTFTHLADGDIYMDMVKYDWRSGSNFPGRNSDWTPLQYILSQPPLKWAWYLLLSTIGFYLLFRAKRKQRVVPVLETKENSSLEYIKTVGRLYFLQNDHKKLASQKMKLFLRHIRNHYSIPTNEISTEMKDRLASKSQVPLELVEEIFTRYKRLQREPSVSNTHLTNFHFAVEEFYKKSK